MDPLLHPEQSARIHKTLCQKGAKVSGRGTSDWWFEHRPAALGLFVEELERAFEMVRDMPGVGQPVAYAHRSGVRRLLMGRIRYHLYYVDAGEVIEVLALWHASRGTGPDE